MQDQSPAPTHVPGISRRTVVRGAAWAAPAVSVATAAPAFAGSGSPRLQSVTWTDTQSGSVPFTLLSNGSRVTAQAPVSVPSRFLVTNTGTGRITSGQMSLTVGRPAEFSPTHGPTRGFGVYTLSGSWVDPSGRTATYRTGPSGPYGFPLTTYSATVPLDVPAGGAQSIPIEFALEGDPTVTVSRTCTFPVILTLTVNGVTVAAQPTSISVSGGAGIL